MDDLDMVPEIDLEEELSTGEVGHGYVICSRCFPKEAPGAMVITLCGQIYRLTGRVLLKECGECVSLKSKLLPAMIPCTFCGHVGA